MAKASAKPAGLEPALVRLEEIVEQMNGECTIDRSIELYAEAVKLVEYASERLGKARQQVDKMMVAKGVQDAEV